MAEIIFEVIMKRVIKFLFRDSFIKLIPVFVLFLNAELFSQDLYTIEGKVTDAKTNEPLAYVSVFLSQTTIGTTTDANGIFKIGKAPKGNYIIVASIVGYEPKSGNIDLKKDKNISVNFQLERSIYQFNQIEVLEELPTKWLDQLEVFKKLFFGKNEFADDCIILNPYKIDFTEDDMEFTAAAHEPIIIQNKALGYKINCVLKSFSFNKNLEILKYRIFPSYTEMNTSSVDSAEEYLSNRKKVYFGSIAQLLYSLSVNNFKFRDYGFELRTSSGEAGQLVLRANEIVESDSVSGKYFLIVKGCLQVKYWSEGKKTFSTICLNTGITQFDPSGFFINPDEFSLSGYMSTMGMATMLPRFWIPPE